MKTEPCIFCGNGMQYARHRQARPSWLPEELRHASSVPVCFQCHEDIRWDRWVDLIERAARDRSRVTGRSYEECAGEITRRVVHFMAYDTGEYVITPEW